MTLPPARPGALEDVLHAEAPPQSLFVLPPPPERPELLTDELGHRAVGVVYRPERDRWGNYVPTVLGDRYDAFLWIDESHALRPLHTLKVDRREPETYPSGVCSTARSAPKLPLLRWSAWKLTRPSPTPASPASGCGPSCSVR
jgi:erythromycin esterase